MDLLTSGCFATVDATVFEMFRRMLRNQGISNRNFFSHDLVLGQNPSISFPLLVHIPKKSIVHPAFTPVFLFQQQGPVLVTVKVSALGVHLPPYFPSLPFPNENRPLCV